MTSMTISRDGRSVTADIYEESGRLHIARDVGKPEARLYRVGRGDPRSSDHRAPMETFTIVGQLVGPDAHEDARTLAEDIVKPHSGGQSSLLDLSAVGGLGTYQVGFVGGRSLSLHYPSGQPDWVSLQLSATVVDNTIGGSTEGAVGSGVAGSGPVTISRGGTSLSLVKNLDVKRRVGRPASATRHDASDEPYLVDRPRASRDEFELSALWNTNAAANASTLVDTIVSPPLGHGTLTLDFGGVYGLGSYTVAPVDAQSARVSWSAGEAGMVRLDTLKLTVVDND